MSLLPGMVRVTTRTVAIASSPPRHASPPGGLGRVARRPARTGLSPLGRRGALLLRAIRDSSRESRHRTATRTSRPWMVSRSSSTRVTLTRPATQFSSHGSKPLRLNGARGSTVEGSWARTSPRSRSQWSPAKRCRSRRLAADELVGERRGRHPPVAGEVDPEALPLAGRERRAERARGVHGTHRSPGRPRARRGRPRRRSRAPPPSRPHARRWPRR